MNASRLAILTACFLLASSLVPAPSEPLSTPVVEKEGRIEAVTIFPDRAIVERRLQITLDGKAQRLRFVQLPATLIPDTIRISADSAQILSISSIKNPDNSSNEPQKKRIAALQAEIREETDRIANLLDQIKSLNSFAISEQNDSSQQLRTGTLSTEALAKALQFFEEQRASYLKRIAASERKRSELQKELQEISSNRKDRISSVEVEVTLAGKAGTEATISLSYMVLSVSWKAEYDLFGSSAGNVFQVKASASIQQSTGEDWKNAKIILSSARPRFSMSPGLLQPWRLTAGSVTRPGEHKPDEKSDSASGEDSASFSFPLKERMNVNSDGNVHRVALHETTLRGEIDHVAIPSISSSVFLRARLKNESNIPLLWNHIQVYLDGNFTGTTSHVEPVTAGADFELFLGSDQRIQISRTLLRGDVVGSGLIEKTVEIENTWQIKITNYSKKDQRITVLDQYPVSADPRITSKFHGSSQQNVTADANGMLKWELSVAPGKTTLFDFRYSIEMTKEIFEQIRRSSSSDDQQLNQPALQKKQQFNLERMLNK